MGEKGGRLERYGGWWKEREGRNGKRRSWRKVRSYRGDIFFDFRFQISIIKLKNDFLLTDLPHGSFISHRPPPPPGHKGGCEHFRGDWGRDFDEFQN